ncbi:hypothetical protein [Haloarcula sp. CBA1130]|nr:hypothetical protein [Haloarcula sp. CBA1130]
MDSEQRLIEASSQGTGNEAVLVQPNAKPMGKTRLIKHYYPGGESDEC